MLPPKESEEQPVSNEGEEQPTSNEEGQSPTSNGEEEQPTSNEGEEQPTSSNCNAEQAVEVAKQMAVVHYHNVSYLYCLSFVILLV